MAVNYNNGHCTIKIARISDDGLLFITVDSQ